MLRYKLRLYSNFHRMLERLMNKEYAYNRLHQLQLTSLKCNKVWSIKIRDEFIGAIVHLHVTEENQFFIDGCREVRGGLLNGTKNCQF